MKHISEYEKAVVISLMPNLMKHIATLRIEINPKEFKRDDYKELFNKIRDTLRTYGFGVNEDKNLAFNSTDFYNVMEIVLAPYMKEVEIVKDIEEMLKEVFGENSVLNRVMIKEKLKKT